MTFEALGTLCPATTDDLDTMLAWRNHSDVRQMMYSKHVISKQEHLDWWAKQQGRDDILHLIYYFQGQKDGVISLSRIDLGDGSATWAFYSRPGAPSGTGSRMEFLLLEKVFFDLGLRRLDCEVLEKNPRVKDLHLRFGFKMTHSMKNLPKSSQSGEAIFQLSLDRDVWENQRTEHSTRLLKRVTS